MIVYVETSALLRWLLGGERAAEIRQALDSAERLVTSRLTLAEARRVVTRALTEHVVRAPQAAEARQALDSEAQRWDTMELTDPVWRRAEERFPIEPIRMLDALHLATALRFCETLGSISMLSVDARVNGNWRALGHPATL